jgi:DNA-binding transcriptional LysR family regulator
MLVPHELTKASPVAQAFRAEGLELPRAPLLGYSQHIRYGLLATGRFVTVVPSSVLRFAPGRAFFKELPIKLPVQPQPVVIITVKGRTLSPVAELFIDCAREVSKPLAQGR